MTRTLWLHAGIPKTSTTSFQSWMRANADDLARQGLLYPPLYGQGNDKHNFLVGDLRHHTEMGRLRQLLEHCEAPRLLLSDEGLSNHLDDFSPESLQTFRKLTADWAVKLILVTRNADDWVRSYHKQCVLNPDNGASPLWGTRLTVSEIIDHPRIQRFLDKSALINDLKAAFGAESLQYFEYEDPDWFAACLDMLGIEGVEHARLPHSNKSLPGWAIEVLRRVNAATSDQSVRNGWKMMLQNYLGTNHTILTNLNTGLDGALLDSSLIDWHDFSAAQKRHVSRFLEMVDLK